MKTRNYIYAVVIILAAMLSVFVSTVYAGYPDTCDAQGRIDPADPESPCKWTTAQAASAEYHVEMEYPYCRHYVYLNGLSELPPNGQGRLQRYDLNGGRLSGAGTRASATLHLPGTNGGHAYWELYNGAVRLHRSGHDDHDHDFNINHDAPLYQSFVRHEGDKVLGRFLVTASVGYKVKPTDEYDTGFYQVVLADLPMVSGLAAHQALADSCHTQLAIEKQRRESLADVERQRIADEQALVVLQAEERAKLDAENARIAQERTHAAERLRITQEISTEIAAANQAWVEELATIKAIEVDIQANLNARTVASIEAARTIKDEYIAIATIRVTETERRVELLNQFYAEALQSWMDFEDLANRAWAEIAANENQIASAKAAIANIQTTFDETEQAVNERLETFAEQVSQQNEAIPSSTPTPSTEE